MKNIVLLKWEDMEEKNGGKGNIDNYVFGMRVSRRESKGTDYNRI